MAWFLCMGTFYAAKWIVAKVGCCPHDGRRIASMTLSIVECRVEMGSLWSLWAPEACGIIAWHGGIEWRTQGCFSDRGLGLKIKNLVPLFQFPFLQDELGFDVQPGWMLGWGLAYICFMDILDLIGCRNELRKLPSVDGLEQIAEWLNGRRLVCMRLVLCFVVYFLVRLAV